MEAQHSSSSVGEHSSVEKPTEQEIYESQRGKVKSLGYIDLLLTLVLVELLVLPSVWPVIFATNGTNFHGDLSADAKSGAKPANLTTEEWTYFMVVIVQGSLLALAAMGLIYGMSRSVSLSDRIQLARFWTYANTTSLFFLFCMVIYANLKWSRENGPNPFPYYPYYVFKMTVVWYVKYKTSVAIPERKFSILSNPIMFGPNLTPGESCKFSRQSFGAEQGIPMNRLRGDERSLQHVGFTGPENQCMDCFQKGLAHGMH